eukprot:scpid24757/ scgid34989/ 
MQQCLNDLYKNLHTLISICMRCTVNAFDKCVSSAIILPALLARVECWVVVSAALKWRANAFGSEASCRCLCGVASCPCPDTCLQVVAATANAASISKVSSMNACT